MSHPRAILLTTIFLFLPAVARAATNLDVPFTPQAPHANWQQPWFDACEETTIAMVDRYYRGETFLSKDNAADNILHAWLLKELIYGPSYDEEAAKIAGIINSYYPWEAYVVDAPSIDQIKEELHAGRPVIAVLSGKELYNPYFADGGPPFHTAVISGYDDERKVFITQEPGTRRGEDFEYSYDLLMAAMHDFVPGAIRSAPPRAVFTRPTLTFSAAEDADNDGFTKAQEYEFGTISWIADTDGDGIFDGEEVRRGLDPLIPSQTPTEGMLFKSSDSPTVYLLNNGQKRAIVSEAVFFSKGWRFDQVKTLDRTILVNIPDGDIIRW